MQATVECYETDLPDTQWDLLLPLLPPVLSGGPQGGRHVEIDRREVINAILYLNRTGCQWRMLPKDFPKRQAVYHYFRTWSANGVWQQINDALVARVPEAVGKNAEPSVGIIDSQSVKTTEEGGIWSATTRPRK